MPNQQHPSRSKLTIAIDRKLKRDLSRHLVDLLNAGKVTDASALVSKWIEDRLNKVKALKRK